MSASSITMGSLPEDLRSEDEEEERVPCSGFRVKYLGCATFSLRKKRLPKGISSMQRPLLEVYSGARKKGDSQRNAHLFALDQRLDVLEYGLVLAQRGTNHGSRQQQQQQQRGGTDIEREEDLVLVKVLTPLSNAVLWAAVRFQARALKRRVLGAAFVPLACCDGVLDRKGFLRLDSKHRFLVSLSHPSVFACVFRRVTDPKSFECHAFACGSAREALALGSALSMVRERSDMPPLTRPPWSPPPQPPPHHYVATGPSSTSSISQRRLHLNGRSHRGRRTTESEEESNSYASVHKFNKQPIVRRVVGRRALGLETDGCGNTSESSCGVRGRRSEKMVVRREPIGGGGAIPAARRDVEDGLWMPVLKSNPTSPSPLRRDNDHRIPIKKEIAHPLPREHSSSSSAMTPSDTSCSAEYLEVSKRDDTRCVGGEDQRRRDVWTMTEAEEEKTIDLSSESCSSSLEGEDEDDDINSRLAPDRHHHQHPVPLPPPPLYARTKATPQTGSAATPVKYTYFGYETYRAPTWIPTKRASDLEDENSSMAMGHGREGMPKSSDRRNALPQLKHQSSGDHTNFTTSKTKSTTKPVNIVGNGTGRITISVPFVKKSKAGRASNGRSSVASSTQTDGSSSVVVLLPTRGVRSFRSDRRVGDWSTLSQTTSEEGVPSILRTRHRDGIHGEASSSSSSYSTSKLNHQGSRTRQRPQKMLRWRSEDRIPAHRSFFWSLKRLSLQSLTKAKHKTGKFISSMRTKLMGSRKSPDGSEDSAYDTAEVCLSPNGKSGYNRTYYTDDRIRHSKSGTKAHRQQSWSFHDLRTAGLERSAANETVRRDHGASEDESVGRRSTLLVRKTKDKQTSKRRTRRKHRRRHSSASDSGVEEYYPSDASALRRSGSEKTLGIGNKRVTRVEIHHGMSEDTFHRWSRTNLQDELGYIP